MQYVELERKFIFIQQVSVFVYQEDTGLQACLQQRDVLICCLGRIGFERPFVKFFVPAPLSIFSFPSDKFEGEGKNQNVLSTFPPGQGTPRRLTLFTLLANSWGRMTVTGIL